MHIAYNKTECWFIYLIHIARLDIYTRMYICKRERNACIFCHSRTYSVKYLFNSIKFFYLFFYTYRTLQKKKTKMFIQKIYKFFSIFYFFHLIFFFSNEAAIRYHQPPFLSIYFASCCQCVVAFQFPFV